MRVLVLTLAFLALPALAMAQQAAPDASGATLPGVEQQQTVPSSPAATGEAGAEGADAQPASVEAHSTAPAAAAAQAGDPTTARWWWLVGAIVVGLILFTVLT
jgi:hypothetical protein